MVSLVITTYNYEHFIERSIRSAMHQSLSKKEYEIIVVNDASKDKTEKILENYADAVRVFNLTENIGLSAARNFGVKKATGRFVVFLDADDYIHSEMLFLQKTFLTLNTSIDAVSVDYFLVDDKENHLTHVNAEEKPIACGIMFRKDLLFDIGLYDEKFKAREEEDLRIRWKKKHNIYNLILPLYRYRMHQNNLTKDQSKMKKFKSLLDKKHKNGK